MVTAAVVSSCPSVDTQEGKVNDNKEMTISDAAIAIEKTEEGFTPVDIVDSDQGRSNNSNDKYGGSQKPNSGFYGCRDD